MIHDDFEMHPFDAQSRSALMEIIKNRHGKEATIITSQVSLYMWYELICEKTVADAILGRIIHSAHHLELTGESLRKKQSNETENLTNK